MSQKRCQSRGTEGFKWQRAAHNELCDRRNDQVLDAAKFKQGDGANEAGFGGIAPKNYWK
jgi:hypothetical protein